MYASIKYTSNQIKKEKISFFICKKINRSNAKFALKAHYLKQSRSQIKSIHMWN